MKNLLLLVLVAISQIPAPAAPQSLTTGVNLTVLVNGGAVVPAFTLTFNHPAGVRSVNFPLNPGFGNPFMVLSIAQADRTFSVPLPQGLCRVEWSGLPDNYSVESITAGSVDLRKSPLTIGREATPRLVVTLRVKEQRGQTVSGRVTGLPQQVLSERPPVTLVGDGRLLSTRIDADGSFEFAQVPPATYAARVARTLGVQPSPTALVVVNSKDVAGVRIDMPPIKEVRGHVTVEGAGPLRFVNFLARGGPISGSVVGTVTVEPDGSFTILLPEAGCQIALVESSLPAGYTLRSLRYGSADLLADPTIRRIPPDDTAKLEAVVAVTAVSITMKFPDSTEIFAAPESPNAWVRVRGRATGVLQGNSPFLVSLYSTEFRVVARGVRGLTYRGGTTESSVTTGLNADGSFEFPKVTRGHYILSVGIPGFAVYQSIEVTDKDLDGLELVIPRRKTVAGQMHVEAGGLLPRSYGFTLNRNDGSGLLVMLTPGCNGAFLAGLPEGEYRVSSRLPSGYVTSFAYGSQNLLRDSLRISPDDDAELRITFAVNTTAGVGIVGGEFFGGVNFSGLENATQGPTPAVPQRGASSSDMLINGCVFIAVERSVPVPANLSLTFTGASKVKVPVMPDGAFHTSLPKGQFRVALDGLPRGYTLKSINEDSTDLRREALRLNDPHTFVLVVLEAR